MSVASSSHVAAAKQVADTRTPDSKPGPARRGVSPGNPLGHPSPLKPAAAPMESDNPYALPIDRKNPYTATIESDNRSAATQPKPIDGKDPYSAAASAKPGNATQPKPIDQHNPYTRR